MSLAYSSSVTGSHHSLRVFSPGTSTAIDASGGAVFFAAGVFYYFLKEQVRTLVQKMADAFRGVQLRKHSKAREKRYSFGYAVSFIFACYQILWTFPKSRYLCSRYLPLVCG